MTTPPYTSAEANENHKKRNHNSQLLQTMDIICRSTRWRHFSLHQCQQSKLVGVFKNQQFYQDIVRKGTRWRYPWQRTTIASWFTTCGHRLPLYMLANTSDKARSRKGAYRRWLKLIVVFRHWQETKSGNEDHDTWYFLFPHLVWTAFPTVPPPGLEVMWPPLVTSLKVINNFVNKK